MKILRHIFSIEQKENYKIINIFGIKIKRSIPDETQSKCNSFIERLRNTDFHLLMKTYDMLNDDFSKKTLINVIKYRLSLDDSFLPPVFKGKEKEFCDVFSQRISDETIVGWNGELFLFDTSKFGKNIKLYSKTLWLYLDLVLKQYEYHSKDVNFEVSKGDYVIDGGAFYGDNALIFAEDAGPKGKVFSFEFMPENVEILHKNIDLNPNLKKRIQIIDKALWSNSTKKLYAKGTGPESFVSDVFTKDARTIHTISIDEFIKQNEINKIDFIKLDIEGSEMQCLQGAKETIKKFKPKLAICVYHKDDDLVTIPHYIKKLVPEYKMYLKHHTDGLQETVLYCMI